MSIDQFDLYRPVDVAAFTGISVSSVYRLIRCGELKHFLVEGAVRVPGIAVQDLLAERINDAIAERAAA